MNGIYEELVQAVIMQAVKDYRAARKRLGRDSESREARRMMGDCERFFRSGWFTALTSVDRRAVLARLEKEAAS